MQSARDEGGDESEYENETETERRGKLLILQYYSNSVALCGTSRSAFPCEVHLPMIASGLGNEDHTPVRLVSLSMELLRLHPLIVNGLDALDVLRKASRANAACVFIEM